MYPDDHLFMEKNLTVYPIASGDKLNVYADNPFEQIRILDMQGNEVYNGATGSDKHRQVDITSLSSNTYIVEVLYTDAKTARSVFVKM